MINYADKFHDINNMCVLKFKNYWFKKIDSCKVNSPLLRARAVCKFDNCRVYTFYIDDETNSSNNCIVVKFCSEGSLSLQHTDGVSAYSRHLSSTEHSPEYGESGTVFNN